LTASILAFAGVSGEGPPAENIDPGNPHRNKGLDRAANSQEIATRE